MSPTVLRRSGPDIEREGRMVTPRASVHFCETCGRENAPFGATTSDGKRQYWCSEHWNMGNGTL